MLASCSYLQFSRDWFLISKKTKKGRREVDKRKREREMKKRGGDGEDEEGIEGDKRNIRRRN